MSENDVERQADTLFGHAAIASYLGLPIRCVYYLVASGALPHIETVATRKSELARWSASTDVRELLDNEADSSAV